MIDSVMTPATATLVFVFAVVAGYQYRRVWKSDGPRWQLWVWGGIAALCLVIVSFVPVQSG
jgi:hypothetical protein